MSLGSQRSWEGSFRHLPPPTCSSLSWFIYLISHLMWGRMLCGLTSDYLWDGLHFSSPLYHVVFRGSESTWRYISSGHKSPRLSPQHAALPGLPRYLFPSILESYVQYPAFYKYGTSLCSYGCKMAWNAGIAGRESVRSPPLFQGKMGSITFPCPRQ